MKKEDQKSNYQTPKCKKNSVGNALYVTGNELSHNVKLQKPGKDMGGGGTKGGGGENGGDPGHGRPVTGPHRFKLFAKLQK